MHSEQGFHILNAALVQNSTKQSDAKHQNSKNSQMLQALQSNSNPVSRIPISQSIRQDKCGPPRKHRPSQSGTLPLSRQSKVPRKCLEALDRLAASWEIIGLPHSGAVGLRALCNAQPGYAARNSLWKGSRSPSEGLHLQGWKFMEHPQLKASQHLPPA